MVREFKLPDVGEGLTEAEIVRWLVDVGDRVAEDQPVAEVETDKAVVEVPAPVNGTVREILAEEGEMVPVGTVIITFDVDGEATEESEPSATEETTDEADSGTADAEPDTETESTGGRTFAAPSTRRLARELEVDIGTVEGSGPGGRITEGDVRAAAEAAEAEAERDATDTTEETVTEASESAVRRIGEDDESDEMDTQSAEAADRDRTLAAPATRKLADETGIDIDSVPTDRMEDGEPFVTPAEIEAYAEAQKRAQEADAEAVSAAGDDGTTDRAAAVAAGEDERIPYRGVRRTIGEQMEKSKYTAPHVSHHDQVDVTELVEARGRLKERAEERGSDLTYMPFVIKAVVAGLKEYPILNSQLDEENDEIILRGEHNIGVATATDAGLMVPVVRNADRKGMLEIADEMNELVGKARDRSIDRDEMRGGTFSITNFGAIGGEYATPIINYPETAILGLGAIKDRPWVVERGAQGAPDGANGDAVRKEVVPRKVMTLSISVDHRVVDGAEAARFVNTVKEYLESPELLLLE